MPERMFAVGDIIRGLTGNGYGITNGYMTEGVVLDVLPIADPSDNPDPIRVLVLLHRANGDGTHIVNAQKFALVRSAEEDATHERCRLCHRPSTKTLCGVNMCDLHYSRYVTSCSGCGTLHHSHNSITVDHREYCRDCARTMSIDTCVSCGRNTTSELIEGYCDECIEQAADDEHERYVEGYQHNHDQHDLCFLKGDDASNNPLFFGIEIEYAGIVGCKHFTAFKRANEILRLTKTVMKSDSSVSGRHALEIAYQPQTMSALLNDRSGMKRVHEILTQAGLNAHHSSCGLHIHVNRNYLDNVSRGVAETRLIALCTALEGKLREVSGRDYSSLNQWASFQRFRCLMRHKGGSASDCIREVSSIRYGRYNAVNITNSHTIEFRFFAGTNDYDVILKRVRLIATIVEFAKHNGVQKCLNVSTFSDIGFTEVM